jgi:tetratricopeptide (TPR) repeat protein
MSYQRIFTILVPVILALGSYCAAFSQSEQKQLPEFILNNRGVKRMNEGDYRGALADFSSAISAQPSYELAFVNRAVAKRKLHDYKGAEEDYNEALHLSPTDVLAFKGRAKLREFMGDYAGAIQDYTELIRLIPEFQHKYLHARALAKRKIGDKSGARSDLEQEKLLLHTLNRAH